MKQMPPDWYKHIILTIWI